MLPVQYYIGLSVVLFTLGALGVLIRRNAIVIFMSVELMLNAANLAFVAFARAANSMDGQIIVFFVIANYNRSHSSFRNLFQSANLFL